MEPERPDPEQLLRQVQEESKRGKLKIFFGACAGAGKTYAMLLAAREKHSENVDVVAGIVETHGRSETAKLIAGLPRLPLQQIEYQGIKINELDLDAALEREPDILLVDELAHTNVAGSRHPKRWQDVQELLDNGIDVYTTLNVQHLESLNDLVANLTGIRVKETIPDTIFDQAHEIVLVDIPSEIILERLNEGKVYLGEFAKQRAAQHFFKMENLIALREIALRRTAERVDALRDIYKKYQSKKASLMDKILVCVGPGPLSTKLVRTGKQLATKLKCSWAAVHVENDQHYRLSQEEQNVIKRTLQLAEQLGAKTETLQEAQTALAIVNYAKKNNFTKIVLGRQPSSRFRFFQFRTLINEVIENSGVIDVYILNEDTQPVKKIHYHHPHWLAYLYTITIIATCTLLGLPAKGWIGLEIVPMIYLTGIVIIGLSSEQNIAILGTILSVICYYIVFMPYLWNLGMCNARDIVTLSILLLTGLVISAQTSRLHQQNLFARQREKYMADLYSLSKKLIATPGRVKIAKVASHHIGEIFDSAATVWLPNASNHLELVSHPEVKSDVKEESVANWAYQHNQIAGWGTNTMPSARGRYVPLFAGDVVLGVLGIIPKDPNKDFNLEKNMLLESLAIQTTWAFQRVNIADQLQKNTKPKV